MDQKVYSRTVRKRVKTVAPNMTDNEIKLDQSKPVQHYPSLAEKIAKSTIYVRNWYVPQAKEKYYYNDRMKRIDKYFPYATGGPLLVDEPLDAQEAEVCYEKAKRAKEWGYRYVVIEADTSLFDALTQLGEA